MDELQELLGKVKALNEKKKYEEVIELLPADVLNKYNNADLYAEKAQAYYRTNNIRLCNELADKALEINSNNIKALYYKGGYYVRQKEYELAIEVYKKAIKIDPKFAFGYNGLGNAYKNSEQYDEAIKAYSKAIDLAPEETGYYFNRARAFDAQKKYANALEDFNKFLSQPSDESTYLVDSALDRTIELEKQLSNPGYEEISEIVKKVKALLLFTDDCVTHYTGLKTAQILILEKKSFRLSEGAFLNDTSEGRELLNFLPKIPSIKDKNDDTVYTVFTTKPFIGSFVPEGKHNDLTLWRMYVKEDREEAKGCAITIKRQLLLKGIASIPEYGSPLMYNEVEEEFNFYRVAYHTKNGTNIFTIPGGNKKENETLNQYMSELHDNVEKYITHSDETDNQNLTELLNTIAYLFKSAEYQYEHELRLVVKGIGFKKESDLKTFPPRVCINLIDITSIISRITLGPKVESAEEWAAAFHYSLDKDGYKPEIVISHLPFK